VCEEVILTTEQHSFINIRDAIWRDEELTDRLVGEGSRLAFNGILREFNELEPLFEADLLLRDVRSACRAGSAFDALLAYSASWPVSSREFKAFEDVYFMVAMGRLCEFQKRMEMADPQKIISVPSYVKVRRNEAPVVAFRPLNAIGKCKVIAVPVRDGFLECGDDGTAAAEVVHLSDIEAVLGPFEEPGAVHELVAHLWTQRHVGGLSEGSMRVTAEIWGRS
jgi:hypothetical protein